MRCRSCEGSKFSNVIDLGLQPPSNSYMSLKDLEKSSTFFPLRVGICNDCLLVQTQDFTNREELFTSDYAYLSSTSKSWLKHSEVYVDTITKKLGLDENSFVTELASNDGYLLQYFKIKGIPCLGVEPTKSTAEIAISRGIKTVQKFFGINTANELLNNYKKADLIIGNNVYAHVPDINDFTKGIAILLADEGVISIEFPHLLNLMKYSQFDTIYHEHYSYLSLHVVDEIFQRHGLRIFDVEQLNTHGGSLRVFGCLKGARYETEANYPLLLEEEITMGMKNPKFYSQLQFSAQKIKDDLIEFLIRIKRDGKTIVGYGAAAKGNTLLNYAGIKRDLLPAIIDNAKSKQSKFMPGSGIPIYSPSFLLDKTIDYIFILPWNIQDELKKDIKTKYKFSGKFITAIPSLQIQC